MAEHPQWLVDLSARIAREDAEDRRTKDRPGQRHDIRAFAGFAGTVVTSREEHQ